MHGGNLKLIVCWFVFHCHGNELKISSTMADIGGVRRRVRSCSNLTEDSLAALLTVKKVPQHM
jgi:hypothetical protein